MTDETDPLGEAAKASQAHPLLSDKEVEAAIAEAHKRVREEAVKAAKAKIIEDEILKMKRAAGQHTGKEAMDEMVTVTLDLAEHSDKIIINGEPFWHGHTYTRPRHVVNQLREIMMRGWIHQDTIDGKDLAQQYARRRLTTVHGRTGAVSNAPQVPA